MKKYVGKTFEKIKQILNNRRARALMGVGVLGIGLASTNIAIKNFDNKKEDEYDNLVSLSYTNMYSEPVNNKKEKMKVGELVEFESSSVGYYNKVDDEWKTVSVEEAVYGIPTPWVECELSDNENNGYIPSVYVDKYYPYSADEATTFTVKEDDTTNDIEELTIPNARVWVFDEAPDEQNSNLYQAIIEDKNDKYIMGYVDINSLKKDTTSDKCIGVINSITYLREYPVVAELNESIIVGQAVNGEQVKIISSDEYGKGDMKEVWHKCQVKGQEDYVYLADYALKQMADYDTELTFEEITGEITSKDCTQTRVSVYEGQKIKADTDNISNGICPVYIEGKDRYYVGYMDTVSLGLEKPEQSVEKEEEVKEQLIEVKQEGNNKLTYIMDFGHFENYEGFIETMDDLLEKDLLSGVVFRIGATSQIEEAAPGVPNGFKIVSFTDDPEEYTLPTGDTILLDTGYQEIKEKSKLHGEEVGFTGKLGSIKEFERYIKEVNARGIPWGYYYYQGSADPNRSSAEMAYVYNVMNKVKTDLGSEYIDSKKLPFMFDLENVQSKVDKDEERYNEVANEQRLLGNGVHSDDYWAINGIDPKEGYNLAADYHNQFMLYSPIVQTCQITSKNLIKMEEELSKEGYTMIYNSSRKINSNETYSEITQIPEITEYTITNLEKYKEEYDRLYDQYLCDRSDAVQTFLNVPALNGKMIDLSLTTQKTVDEVVAGVYKHEKKYFDQIQEAEKGEKYTVVYKISADKDESENGELEVEEQHVDEIIIDDEQEETINNNKSKIKPLSYRNIDKEDR